MLKTYLFGIISIFAALVMAPMPPALAQQRGDFQQRGNNNDNFGRFIDELDALIDEGDRRRRADPSFIRELRSLIHRRGGIWTDRLLVEEFRDGDYTRNPSWVLTGDPVDFYPGEGLILEPGLRGAQRASPPPPDRRDLANDLLGALLGQGAQVGRGAPPPAAVTGESRLVIRIGMSNAFSATIEFTSYGRAGRFEFGAMTGDGEDGYRVIYQQDSRRSLRLIVYDRRGASAVDSERGRIDLEDGVPHEIQLTRDENGEMIVRLDRVERLRATNRVHDGRFPGFMLGASGDGRFGVGSVVIYGRR